MQHYVYWPVTYATTIVTTDMIAFVKPIASGPAILAITSQKAKVKTAWIIVLMDVKKTFFLTPVLNYNSPMRTN